MVGHGGKSSPWLSSAQSRSRHSRMASSTSWPRRRVLPSSSRPDDLFGSTLPSVGRHPPARVVWLPGRRAAGGRPQGRP
jgi:hypothetical protein